MKRSMLLSCFAFLCVLSISGAATHVIAPVPSPALTPACTPAMQTSIASCPAATGCGDKGDALLNQAKNRFDAVTNPANKTLTQIAAIDEPAWDTGKPRDSIQGPV